MIDNEFVVKTAKGREMIYAPLMPYEEYQIYNLFDVLPNERAAQMLLTASSVRCIDGVEYTIPRSRDEAEHRIEVISDDGFKAIWVDIRARIGANKD